MDYFETKEMTPVQMVYFCILFDKHIGIDREINDSPSGDNTQYAICMDLEGNEFNKCLAIQEKVLKIPTTAIQFDTGRFYSKDQKHIIIAYSEGVPYDSIDLFDDDCDLTTQWVIFIDPVRMIKGKIIYCQLNHLDIMSAYDAGRYWAV